MLHEEPMKDGDAWVEKLLQRNEMLGALLFHMTLGSYFARSPSRRVVHEHLSAQEEDCTSSYLLLPEKVCMSKVLTNKPSLLKLVLHACASCA